MAADLSGPELTVVMPCLNEEETLEACILEIQEMARKHHIATEIIVADNGSTDSSVLIAERNGAKVVIVPEKGYGSALNHGILSSTAEFVLMADSDMSYNFSHAPRFLEKLHSGADLAMGNRFAGGIAEGAMPALHKYFGNPVLSLIARVLFNIPINDFHCGLRAFKKSSYLAASPVTTGMEFATEMVIKMANAGANIVEVPTELRTDGRSRKPHLRSFPDGWRHLKLMLLYSPKFLQIYPGIGSATLGMSGILQYIMTGKIDLIFAEGSLQSALISLVALLFGTQLFLSGSLNIEYARQKNVSRLGSESLFVKFLKSRFAISAALLSFLLGFIVELPILIGWEKVNFGYLEPLSSSRHTFLMIVLFLTGTQILIGALQIRQFTSKFW
jgi:glycosyltransferase involved in cell wall biosynthesis